MMRTELRRRLKALEAELAKVDDLDEADRLLLETVSGDINRTLDAHTPDASKLNGARTALGEFNARHPAITDAVNRVAVLLAEMGI